MMAQKNFTRWCDF